MTRIFLQEHFISLKARHLFIPLHSSFQWFNYLARQLFHSVSWWAHPCQISNLWVKFSFPSSLLWSTQSVPWDLLFPNQKTLSTLSSLLFSFIIHRSSPPVVIQVSSAHSLILFYFLKQDVEVLSWAHSNPSLVSCSLISIYR